jgi:hypothetical protein
MKRAHGWRSQLSNFSVCLRVNLNGRLHIPLVNKCVLVSSCGGSPIKLVFLLIWVELAHDREELYVVVLCDYLWRTSGRFIAVQYVIIERYNAATMIKTILHVLMSKMKTHDLALTGWTRHWRIFVLSLLKTFFLCHCSSLDWFTRL